METVMSWGAEQWQELGLARCIGGGGGSAETALRTMGSAPEAEILSGDPGNGPPGAAEDTC